ncbi:transposase family protein [Corynebacterium sp. CCUG 60159]|nr:transposase family protein [Corynebacterium pseudogenitalium]
MSCPTRGPVCRSTCASNAPTVELPKLKATRPFEVICWDITFLPLLERGKHLALHMAIDLYSRETVGFGFATNPNADIARAMFTEVITLAGGNDATITVVHSDNGKTMKSV